MIKHIYIHGHEAVDTVPLELKPVPSGAKVVFYAPLGSALSDSFAEKIYNFTDQYKDVGRWAEGWNGWRKNVHVVPRNGTIGSSPELPTSYPEVTDLVFDFALSGGLSLPRSGIYGEKKNGADNLIYDIGKNTLSLTKILSYLDVQKLLDKDTYIHWLACHSVHFDHMARYSGWNVTTS